MIGQLPSLRSLCLTRPHNTVAAFSVTAPEGYSLPAPCMLTQLTSLSLAQWPLEKQITPSGATPSIVPLSGISLLTNLQSFIWTDREDIRPLPLGVLRSLPSLKCLTVVDKGTPQPPLSLAGMTGLQVLEVAGNGFCNMLRCLSSVNNITKLICRNAGRSDPYLFPLAAYTGLQHLVLEFQIPYKVSWVVLNLMTWVTILDIRWIWVKIAEDQGLVSLVQALRTMQLTSLQLSFRIDSRATDGAQVLAQIHSLSRISGVARFPEPTIQCVFRPYIYMQSHISKFCTFAGTSTRCKDSSDVNSIGW